jgi:hypothetical protein
LPRARLPPDSGSTPATGRYRRDCVSIASGRPRLLPILFLACAATTPGAATPDFLWTRVTIDNSGNTQPQTGRFVSFSSSADFDPLSEVQATFACSVLARYAPKAGDPRSVFDAYEGLYTGFCRGQTAQVPVAPGETLTYWLLYEGDTWPQYRSIWAGAGNELK